MACPWERLPLERVPVPPSVIRTYPTKDLATAKGGKKQIKNKKSKQIDKDNKKDERIVVKQKSKRLSGDASGSII